MLVDKLKRGFLTSGITKGNDPLYFAQDPTYLSFHLNFFLPDVDSGYTADEFLMYSFAHDGLFRKSQFSKNDSSASSIADRINNYDFTDSAEDYLYSIGAVTRLASLESFKLLLRNIQDKTPWYFQKISGTESFYTIDPNLNTIKDGILTVDCLESVDQRVSLLADLYRHAAWDAERKREILPYNVRTFKMRVHVFEMRNFDASLQTKVRTVLDMSDHSTISTITDHIDPYTTVRTYELGQCEFDFYSAAPSYLSEISVAEVPMSTFQFKIKFKTVRLTAEYPFYKYVVDNVSSLMEFPSDSTPFDSGIIPSTRIHPNPFYDAAPVETIRSYFRPTIETEMQNTPNPTYENVYGNPQSGRIGGVTGQILGALESRVNTAISRLDSNVNSVIMGNVYDNVPSPSQVSQALLGFFNPDLGVGSATQVTNQQAIRGNVFDEPRTTAKPAEQSNVYRR